MSAAPLLPGGRRQGLVDSAALSALVRDSVAGEMPRRVLLVRLAPLAQRLRGEHHQRLVRETLEPLLRPSRARLFVLANGDLVAAGPEHGWHMESVAQRLETLLEPEATRSALAVLRLPDQATQVLAAIEEALTASGPPPPAPGPGPSRIAAGRSAEARAMSGARLARILSAANIATFLRCRAVMQVDATAEVVVPVPGWTQWSIAVPELCAAVLEHPAPAALAENDAWLRGVLDQRLLAELAQPEEASRRGAMGLCLGLAALDSPAFRRLEGMVAPELRQRGIIALSAATVLADPTGFQAARQVLAGRGWRLALDIPHPSLLALLPPARLGIDLVRLPHDPALAAAGLPPGLSPDRVVLTGVDRPAALGWGMEAGIRLFEGRLLGR